MGTQPFQRCGRHKKAVSPGGEYDRVRSQIVEGLRERNYGDHAEGAWRGSAASDDASEDAEESETAPPSGAVCE